jgi:hypothetical protein
VKVASLHPAALLGEQVGCGIEVRAIEFEQEIGNPVTPERCGKPS